MSFAEWIITKSLLALGSVAQALSHVSRQRLGSFLGRRMMGLSPKRRAITADNIAQAIPHLDSKAQAHVMRRSYENLGIVMTELLCIPAMNKSELTSMVKIPGFERVLDRHHQGKPTIFLSAHYGNWEYLAITAGILLNAPVTIVAHPQSNAAIDQRINSYRTRFGNEVIAMGEAARPLVKTLSAGGTVAFLVDQYGQHDKDPWIEFMGRQTPTYEAPAALALRYNAPIFYAFAERLPDGSYHAPIKELPMDDLKNDHSGIVELTKRHVRVLEDAIHICPHLWSWQHRRWR